MLGNTISKYTGSWVNAAGVDYASADIRVT
jgi:hypothetical protein